MSNGHAEQKGSISHEEMKSIADKVYKTPYSAEAEGPLQFPDYAGLHSSDRIPAGQQTTGFWNCEFDQDVTEVKKLDNRPMLERPSMTIADSALQFVGNTPLIKMSRLHKSLGLPEGVELLGKAEYYSAGGSVKDRIALRMIEDAEKSGY